MTGARDEEERRESESGNGNAVANGSESANRNANGTVERALQTLSRPAPEPTAAAIGRIEVALADEARAIRTERELAPFGLVPAYRFARRHLKAHFFGYLATAAAATAVVARLALGPAFPRVVQFLAGGM